MSQILDKLTFNLQGNEYVLRSTETLATTYSDLRSKRDHSELIPGMWYRITDYVTMTAQENTSTAGHPFEILVQALTENTLSEDAKAYVKKLELLPIDSLELYYNGEYIGTEENTYKMGSGYFSYNWGPGGNIDLSIANNYVVDDSGLCIVDKNEVFKFYFKPEQEYIYLNNHNYASSNTYFNNSNLSAWEIKYCLDNDTDRFAWADPDGYGVIYYLKDEFNNSAPYDFKNIQFRPTFIRDSFTSSSVVSKLNYIEQANITGNGFGTVVTSNIIETKTNVYYTFTNGNNEDASKSGLCHDNIIEPYYGTDATYDLPKIVISSSTGQIHGNKFLQCSHNIYVKGKQFMHNIFDENCDNVIIEGSNNYSFYDNHITSALNVILGHGNMWDNRLFSLNNSILYSNSHVKNNHFLGLASGFKFFVSSLQNIHVFGSVSNVTVLPTLDQAENNSTGYLLACVFQPYSSNIQITGFKWLEKAIFQGPSNLHLQAPDYTKNYGNIMVYPGDYTDVGTITDIPLSSGQLCEIKRNNSTTIMI